MAFFSLFWRFSQQILTKIAKNRFFWLILPVFCLKIPKYRSYNAKMAHKNQLKISNRRSYFSQKNSSKFSIRQILRFGNTVDYPLKGEKGTIWEGGTRSVAFIHGPRVLKKSGMISHK